VVPQDELAVRPSEGGEMPQLSGVARHSHIGEGACFTGELAFGSVVEAAFCQPACASIVKVRVRPVRQTIRKSGSVIGYPQRLKRVRLCVSSWLGVPSCECLRSQKGVTEPGVYAGFTTADRLVPWGSSRPEVLRVHLHCRPA